MSLQGQWVARYSGTNRGLLVVDVDRVDEVYFCVATAWEDDNSLPNFLARFSFAADTTQVDIADVPIQPVFRNGTFYTDKDLVALEARGLAVPNSANLSLSFSNGRLKISWKTSIPTAGRGSASLPASRAANPSQVRVIRRIKTWSAFKNLVGEIQRNKFLFRGQSDSKWRLRTAYHRTGRANFDRYFNYQDWPDIQRTLSSVAQYRFNFSDPLDYAAALNIAQHHGYPTPLLDWTHSPYVAAFFAYRNIRSVLNSATSTDSVRIFKLNSAKWNLLPRINNVFPTGPHLTIIAPHHYANPRAIPQQSVSTFTNVDDIESHILRCEKIHQTEFIEAIDLPHSIRDTVMKELDLMGINAGSMFPTLDGAFESLRERNFG